ncbi:hypothetical protein [Paenibacillus piri]|uniref:Amidase n=1 Tax=Paenibacillus piri TaxID=2547395 RepID=A0A4R5KGM6_9BACL|nr:hypothetical protein [Paenibacillus piri]TDF93855.1 hypothetical protein E1757_26085 [Paenibacillus piri]
MAPVIVQVGAALSDQARGTAIAAAAAPNVRQLRHLSGDGFDNGDRMTSCLTLLILLFANFAPTVVTTIATPPSTNMKATWLWDTSLIHTNDSRNSVLQFAKEQRVTRIYVQIDPALDPGAYRTFIKGASAAGIQIHALDGAPDWIAPDRRHRISDTVDWVNRFNNAALPEERFTGIQVDIEPYTLPEWNTNRDTVVQRWLDTVTLFAAKTKSSSSLTASAALPFWLDEIPMSGSGSGSVSLMEAMMRQLDEVTLMSYRNQAKALADIALTKLELGDRLGKKVSVGVETNSTKEPAFITFYGEGRARMEIELLSIDKLLRNYASYAGVVIHDYSGWRKLKE